MLVLEILGGNLQEVYDVPAPNEKFVDAAGFLVLLKFGQSPHVLKLGPAHSGRIVLSTHLDGLGDVVRDTASLRSDEGVIARLG